ncbi:MAG TPA: hypothetical protein DCY13_00970, partial [Verrucomicrobiales bacterium]|nr:hypothetical protein [Verrucomicrobiales bacterium]
AAGLQAVCGSQAAPSFYTSGSTIKDANDNTFVIRGMNHPVVWHYNNSWNTIDDLDTAKYNSVRIVWDDVTYATVAQLSNTVARCIQYKL